jgi:MFS superfamily sulfate permease-like transporter
VLACIIVSSLMSLMNIRAIKELLRFSKSDCYIALLTILATLFLDGVYGIALGVIGSLIWSALSSVFQQR